jgi:uncharacterized protein
VIVDFHAHIYPPRVIEELERYLAADQTFRGLYSDRRSRFATAEDLLESMDSAGVDATVTLGFAWADPETCRLHNDYLLEAAARSGGRLIPFCTVQPASDPEGAVREIERCVSAGAKGIGELRPDNQCYGLEAGGPADSVAAVAQEHGLVLLFHVSEPTGHHYAGKDGLDLDPLVGFAERWPGLAIVAAHWGGGLPFYTLMPEVRASLRNTSFDTAATSLLYDHRIYRSVADLVGAERILFASDFPLLSQKRCLDRLAVAPLTEREKALVLGENARRLLRL